MIKCCKIIWPLLLLLAMACSGHKIVKEGGTEKGIIDKKKSAFPTSSFILGSGDEIAINVWRHEDLKRTVQIDPSGNIYVPLAGKVEASGLTVSQLREKIASGLSKYLIDPQVDINVSSLKSRKIHILGEVESPGTFILDQKMLAWEAISQAGGFTADANEKGVLLVRNEKGAARVAALNIHDMLRTGKIYQDIHLRSGDIIYVPPSFIANLERFMQRFNNIITPFISLERGIIMAPEVEDVLRGKEDEKDIVISP
ncbi:MAG: polysaccharide export protein [Deltaproteobacteria bacterium]|nr:polysaccharide export protein [Deltaproteobacteria bacterium]